ncbi:MAG: ABC-type uncharacterized transport system involved in gliding motility auxiliary subunit [Planctomycetota bacterium]|jgi:ABC-type uncharacterized transport system involved in gliding motility auxiliary subunit
MRGPLDRKSARLNGWLTALILLVLAVEANRLAPRFLNARRDFSEDQLYAISDATRSILGRLDDRLSLKAYVTSDVELGSLALLQARVRAQLEELAGLNAALIDVTELDPSVDSTALVEAQTYGLQPYQDGQRSGTRITAQSAYLGLVLRYRGRQEVLPRLNPWSMEAEFAGAVHRLLADRRRVVGWLGDAMDPESAVQDLFGRFSSAQARLGVRYDVRPLQAARLEAGTPIPDEINVVLVVRPDRLHPRTVFALDQFVQRGGRLLICVDQVRMGVGGDALHAARGEAVHPTGLESLLHRWGAPVIAQHLWDVERPGQVVRAVSVPGQPGQAMLRPLSDPSCPSLAPGSGAATFPPTANFGGLQTYWVQPIAQNTVATGVSVPTGVSRLDVLSTSERTWPMGELLAQAPRSEGNVDSRSIGFGAVASAAQSFTIACVLEGRFPSPFEKGAPKAFDATIDERGAAVVTTDEPVLSAAAEAAVVVMGDADWMRDPGGGDYRVLMPGMSDGNGRLLDDLVDWLQRDDELIAVRGKQPRSRPLRDLDAEELAKVGLSGPQESYDSQGELRARYAAADKAKGIAAGRRMRAMLTPLVVVLGLLLALALGLNLAARRSA